MKKRLLSLLFIVIMLFTLTGCGNSSNTAIAEKLNEIVESSVTKWDEDGFAHTFSISDIQNSLNTKGYKYIIIASGDKEFTAAPSDTKYTEKIDNYSGKLYSSGRMMEKDMQVNYCLVLDKESGKYYNIKITIKTHILNDTKKDYPYFGVENEVK